jgi:hypothetical protein
MNELLKENCNNLNEIYTFWYHNPDNVDWSLESYIELLEFSTIEEFWVLDKFVRKDMIENGMFFIMKKSVKPIWECSTNINGGCISWKVDRKNSYKSWIDCIGHFIMKDFGEFTNLINGVSISPKKNSSIIKLWFKEEINIDTIQIPKSFCLVDDKTIYKSHIQNIDKDKNKKLTYNKKY